MIASGKYLKINTFNTNFSFTFNIYSLRMRKDLRDIFDHVRATSPYIKNNKSEGISSKNNKPILSIPRTTAQHTQSEIV